MTAAPDTRVPPIPAGTLCRLDGATVRAYANIWPGEVWDGKYRVIERDRKWSSLATREQLQPIGGGS